MRACASASVKVAWEVGASSCRKRVLQHQKRIQSQWCSPTTPTVHLSQAREAKPLKAKWTLYAVTQIMDKLGQTGQQSDKGPPSIRQFYSSGLRTTINTMDGTTQYLSFHNPKPLVQHITKRPGI